MRLAGIWLGFGLLAASAFGLATTAAADVTASILTPHLIALKGGRRLNLTCVGHGFPTLVFEQGSGEDILDWKKLQRPVTALTRACFYDRAGFGYSDSSEKPATALEATDDLHDLLRIAKIKLPVVLVGHSLGGLIATLYTDRFPADVGGLVLVDPSFSSQFDYSISASGKRAVEDEQRIYIGDLRRCLNLTEATLISSKNPRNCFSLSLDLTDRETRYLIHQYTNPSYYRTHISESENFLPVKDWKSVDGLQEQRVRRSFGHIPVEVLTAGIAANNKAKSKEDNKNFADWWRKGHQELADRSTRGEEILVYGARHNIQIDRPDAVLAPVEKVIALLRAER